MDEALVVRGLGKQFDRYHSDRPTTLKEAVLGRLRRLGPADRFWALRDVSFRLAPGRMLGVIGANGAGKSTLLRLVGGVGRPDEGDIELHGHVGALLDLGAGFHPDLTGRENAIISAVVGGLTRAEVSQRFDSIVAFAELEDAIDSPLRTYSTGMQMRLGFAVAVHTLPDVLLIDEILAVGDAAFQRRCLRRIDQMRAGGCAILLVSHDTTMVRRLCDEVLWLRAGRVVSHGPADILVAQYLEEMSNETRRRTPAGGPARVTASGTELRLNENRYGSLEIEIDSVRLLDKHGMTADELESGDALRVEVEYSAERPMSPAIVSITIRRDDGLLCYDTSTAAAALDLPDVSGRTRASLVLDRLDLNGGRYFVDVGIYESSWAYAYDYHWGVYPLIVSQPGGQGVLRPPHRWEIDNAEGGSVAASVPALETR